MQSTVKSLFKSDKPGNAYYGFIVSSDTKKDYYFSAKDTNGLTFDELKKGTIVEFNPVERADKRYANNVKLAQVTTNTAISAMPESEKDDDNTLLTDKISYRDYEKQIIESLNYIDEVDDPSDFEDSVHLILRLLGVHSAYQFDRKKQAGKADGIFEIENLIVMYDCTLRNDFIDFKKDQIENYINKLSQKEQLTVDILRVDGSSMQKRFNIENKKRQIWIITRGKTRELNDLDNIKVKEVCIFDLIKLISTRIKDSSYNLDRLTGELLLLGN